MSDELKMPYEWEHGMAFRYIGEMHKDDLAGSIHYFVGFDPTISANAPVFIRIPCEGVSILHWLGFCHEYTRAPEHDRLRPSRADAGVDALDGIPDMVRDHIISMGRVEWGAVAPKPDAQHLSYFKDTLDITRANFGLKGDQSLNGVYLDGTEVVLCHTGISPNSPENARIIVALWNYLHDKIKAAAPKGGG